MHASQGPESINSDVLGRLESSEVEEEEDWLPQSTPTPCTGLSCLKPSRCAAAALVSDLQAGSA